MRQCAGLNATSPPPPNRTAPRISIVNRAYKAGRSIVTAAETLDKIRSRDIPATQNIELTYMEGKSFQEQVCNAITAPTS